MDVRPTEPPLCRTPDRSTQRERAPVAAPSASIETGLIRDRAYWPRLPWNWFRQIFRNGSDILRVWDIVRLRPLPAGLIGLDHPWVTGINPATGREIWIQNLVYASPRDDRAAAPDDHEILLATGRFLTKRVRQSAITPEIPVGPGRRMPHAINYMHGSSHYNSGIMLFNDLDDAFRHVTDPRFRSELQRFVKLERREVLLVLRRREYDPKQYAYFSCCLRSLFPWFCNPNGPQARVLWGNSAPFPAANLITGHWADDVYALKRPDGAASVVRPPIDHGAYFTAMDYGRGRASALWPERLLAWGTYLRVQVRGERGGMFFVDRRRVYADQIERRRSKGLATDDRARF